MIRMREQKKVFEITNEGKRHQALRLSDYFEEAGLTTPEEQKFIKELQKLEQFCSQKVCVQLNKLQKLLQLPILRRET